MEITDLEGDSHNYSIAFPFLDVTDVPIIDVNVTQVINIPDGWSTIGFYLDVDYLHPDSDGGGSKDVADVFGGIQGLEIVKDYNGVSYLPAWNFNGIGDLTNFYGYQIKVTNDPEIQQSLTLKGPLLNDGESNTISFSFPVGWFTFAWFFNYEANVIDIFGGVNEVQVIKNNSGQLYYPLWGFNGIGNFIPGQAYLIRSSSSFTLDISITGFARGGFVIPPKVDDVLEDQDTGAVNAIDSFSVTTDKGVVKSFIDSLPYPESFSSDVRDLVNKFELLKSQELNSEYQRLGLHKFVDNVLKDVYLLGKIAVDFKDSYTKLYSTLTSTYTQKLTITDSYGKVWMESKPWVYGKTPEGRIVFTCPIDDPDTSKAEGFSINDNYFINLSERKVFPLDVEFNAAESEPSTGLGTAISRALQTVKALSLNKSVTYNNIASNK